MDVGRVLGEIWEGRAFKSCRLSYSGHSPLPLQKGFQPPKSKSDFFLLSFLTLELRGKGGEGVSGGDGRRD